MSIPRIAGLPCNPTIEAENDMLSNGDGARCIHTTVGESLKEKQDADGDVTDIVEHTSSRPPSPPESRASTPRVLIMECPVRLMPLLPPPNYGSVEKHVIYRSAFPSARNIDFLQTLHISTILTLVDSAPPEGYEQWIQNSAIDRHCITIGTNKDGQVNTTLESICEALLHILNPMMHPVYIHCNQGRHRTGCVVACLRKVQKWPMEDILTEYSTYAYPKARPGDVEFIKSFDPQCLNTYLQQKCFIDEVKCLRRHRGVSDVDVYAIAEDCLCPHELSSLYTSAFNSPEDSTCASPDSEVGNCAPAVSPGYENVSRAPAVQAPRRSLSMSDMDTSKSYFDWALLHSSDSTPLTKGNGKNNPTESHIVTCTGDAGHANHVVEKATLKDMVFNNSR